MNDQDWLNLALASIHTGQWFGWKKLDDNGKKIPSNQRMTYENIVILDNTKTKPNKAEVNSKIEELKVLLGK